MPDLSTVNVATIYLYVSIVGLAWSRLVGSTCIARNVIGATMGDDSELLRLRTRN